MSSWAVCFLDAEEIAEIFTAWPVLDHEIGAEKVTQKFYPIVFDTKQGISEMLKVTKMSVAVPVDHFTRTNYLVHLVECRLFPSRLD